MKLGAKSTWLILVVVALLIPALLRNNIYWLSVFVLCMVNVVIASGLRTIMSTGQLCIGILAFTGIGAYTAALLAMRLNFPIWATLPIGGLVAMFVTALIAYPAVRTTGIYFAMVTLFFGQVVQLVLTDWRSLTGGSTGLVGIPSIGTLTIFGSRINFVQWLPYAYFVIFIMILCLLLLYRIDRSHLGTFLTSIEQEESVAKSVGINTVGFKVISFCVGSFVAGVGGVLYAHYLKLLVPDSFGMFPSIYILIAVIAGGRKHFIGPIIGAVILTLIPQLFSSFKAYQPFIYVLALFLVLYLLPGGIVDLPATIRSRLPRVRERRVAHD